MAYAKKRKELLAEGYSVEEAKEGARIVVCLHVVFFGVHVALRPMQRPSELLRILRGF